MGTLVEWKRNSRAEGATRLADGGGLMAVLRTSYGQAGPRVLGQRRSDCLRPALLVLYLCQARRLFFSGLAVCRSSAPAGSGPVAAAVTSLALSFNLSQFGGFDTRSKLRDLKFFSQLCRAFVLVAYIFISSAYYVTLHKVTYMR